MDLHFTAEEQRFRRDVRDFFRAEIPQAIRRKILAGLQLTREEIVRSHRILAKKGWSVPFWPLEWGGTGWSPVKYLIFREEMQGAGVPEPVSGNTYKLGPVLIQFGSQQQKEYFLPRLRTCDLYFCQGYSEPGAGSDLAGLRTSARRARDGDGEHYVVNGQKLWTSEAQHADWVFVLVRTDPDSTRQKGISFLLIDLKSPGITIRPVHAINGRHVTNEVFFDEVRVPVENRVGEENQGWNAAKVLLSNERAAQAKVGVSRARLLRVREALARRQARDGALPADRHFLRRIVEAEVELKALEITSLRVAASDYRSSRPDPASSVLKLRGAELQQRTTELLVEAAGPHAAPFHPDADAMYSGPLTEAEGQDWAPPAMETYLYWRVATIGAGTSEIQRNIIAKSILGL